MMTLINILIAVLLYCTHFDLTHVNYVLMLNIFHNTWDPLVILTSHNLECIGHV
jgi:hypothetical protein